MGFFTVVVAVVLWEGEIRGLVFLFERSREREVEQAFALECFTLPEF